MAKLTAAQIYRPSVVMWNRLEGRPRTAEFDRALKAEVRDALWMLSKQWQMGEFLGDDAGSPVLAKAHFETTQLTKYQAGSEAASPLVGEVPLEATVENRPLVFRQAGREVALDLRLLLGRQWLKLVASVDPDLPAAYVARYDIDPPSPDAEADAPICAHSAVWQQFAAVAGRKMDGYKLLEHLEADAGNRAWNGIAEADTQAKRDRIDELAAKWTAWYRRLFLQPAEGDNPSWKPGYLEHQFACSAPSGATEEVLTAEEYHHGHLDWYNLDIDKDRESLEGEGPPAEEVQRAITRKFVPSTIRFGGMPNRRWWAFEDGRTTLDFVQPDTTDLNKLLLLDFILTYADDWFSLPVTLPVGSLTDVRGLMVTNVFGEKTWVQAAGRGADEAWQRWRMYNLAVHGTDNVAADLTAVVLPVARKVQEGTPLEEVYLLRDEVANMVWGAEARVPLPTGRSQPGRETALELRSKLQQLVLAAHPEPPAPLPETGASVRYEVVSDVPEHWIPFVPVHVDNQFREVQLQRAALPRILRNDPAVPKKVEPRTSLLRAGLDSEPRQTYFLHEEEVSRAGAKVRLGFQRTRWFQGKVCTWLGIRKQTGRGEGSSGLAFDQVLPKRGG